MQIEKFITVVQRRRVGLEDRLFPKVEPLFQIETHMTLAERLQLLETAMKMPRGFVACEIGSYLGASAGFLAVAASLLNGHVHCVDTWDNRAMDIEPPEDTFDAFRRNTAAHARFITIHRGESVPLAPEIPAGLDLLFLDGDHSYPATRADLFAYAPRLKPGGVLLLHDFNYETVAQATREYLATLPAQRVRDLGMVDSLKGFQFV